MNCLRASPCPTVKAEPLPVGQEGSVSVARSPTLLLELCFPRDPAGAGHSLLARCTLLDDQAVLMAILDTEVVVGRRRWWG